MTRALAIAMVTILGGVAGLVIYAVLAVFVLHGEVTGTSLHTSVEQAAGSVNFLDRGCTRERAPRRWRCSVPDRSASGGVTYRVTVRPGSSCWDARLIDRAGGDPMPKTISGCVKVWQPQLI